MLRTLINGSCLCDDGYFDNGTVLCVICHSTCLTCSDGTATGCLSCNATQNLTLVGSSCVLNSGTCGDGVLASG
jgi:proprotein convertase subtilisin/kexin type 5